MDFVAKDSIVRHIWSSSDIVLFIFAGSAAEFALNKAVDWLYFTGRLPADPLGRLFSTVGYAKKIIFADEQSALQAIDMVTAIHKNVENQRQEQIPAWAYRDVLYMLIYYSVAAYELLERRLTPAEKNEIYDVFYRMGTRMGLIDLPETYTQWLPDREHHMHNDLTINKFTSDLFAQYKKHLGPLRYAIMLKVQSQMLPPSLLQQLKLRPKKQFKTLISIYKITRFAKLNWLLEPSLLPKKQKIL